MTSDTVKNQISELPSTPGVYRYFDKTNKLLYIGKAVNLKRRVSSYFQSRRHEPRIEELVAQIDHLEWTEVGSVIEALILEANEINAKQPPFNVRQKDDKTFATIIITKEAYPRVLVIRPTSHKVKVPLLHVFGPYTSADQARLALQVIRKMLPFRTNCKVGEKPGRGCLDYQLGLCPGPCADVISEGEYTKMIRRVVLFLEGKKQLVVRDITRAMKQAARAQQFEGAAQLRNQLFALDHIRDVALLRKEDLQASVRDQTGLPQRIEAYDISNTGSGYAVGSMVVILNSKKAISEYRKFQIKTVIGQNDLLMMEEVLYRRLRHLEWPLPDLIILDGGETHRRMGERVLRKMNLKIPLLTAAKGPERKKLDIYTRHPNYQQLTPELLELIRLGRDEAHRFAIRYHRYRRTQGFLDENQQAA